jgi:hypothetical protein
MAETALTAGFEPCAGRSPNPSAKPAAAPDRRPRMAAGARLV